MEKFLHALFLCHQLPERSFFFHGRQFPICARCTGIFIGYLLGIGYALIFGKIPSYIALILILPLIIDGGFQHLRKWESTNIRRLITGMLAGIGTDYLLFYLVSTGYNHGKQITRFLLN